MFIDAYSYVYTCFYVSVFIDIDLAGMTIKCTAVLQLDASLRNLIFDPRHEKTCFCICKNKGADQLPLSSLHR